MEQLLCAFLQSKVTDMLQEQDTCMLKVTVLNVEAVEQKALVRMSIANITLHNSYVKQRCSISSASTKFVLA
jgi:hypothetical protein